MLFAFLLNSSFGSSKKKIKEENKLPKEEVTDETVDNNLISENNIYDEHYSDLPYEEEDDIVTMEDGYMEEAER